MALACECKGENQCQMHELEATEVEHPPQNENCLTGTFPHANTVSLTPILM